MRTISPTLLAAQNSASRVPHVQVRVLDMLAGVTRPVFERLYTGSEELFHHAATISGDGSPVRARVDSATRGLYVQRVSNPGSGADFSSWSSLDTAGTGCNVALCSQGAAVLLFFLNPFDGKTLYVRESGDNGATWAQSWSPRSARSIGWRQPTAPPVLRPSSMPLESPGSTSPSGSAVYGGRQSPGVAASLVSSASGAPISGTGNWPSPAPTQAATTACGPSSMATAETRPPGPGRLWYRWMKPRATPMWSCTPPSYLLPM